MAVTIAEQKYGPTTGTGSGWIGMVMCAVFVLPVLSDRSPERLRLALLAAVGATLVWCFVLRPRVIIREPSATLLLRNAFSTWEVPLAAITSVQVKAITRVRAGEVSYDGIGVGRRVRAMVRKAGGRAEPRRLPHRQTSTPEDVADLVIEQVLAAAERAREAGRPTEPVLRRWAWVEIVVLGAVLVGGVLTFVV